MADLYYSWDEHIKNVSYSCLDQLGRKLSYECAGKDWRDLACILGYNSEAIQDMRLRECTNPGKKLLENWGLTRGGATLRVLKRSLGKMGRLDLLEDLTHIMKSKYIYSAGILCSFTRLGILVLVTWAYTCSLVYWNGLGILVAGVNLLLEYTCSWSILVAGVYL